LAIISITAIVAGFNSTKFYEASRNLSLDGVTRIEIASQLIGLAGILGWIIWDRSIWALVAGNVCSAVSRLILGHRWLPGSSNRWEWDESAVASIVRFGKWIFASSILGFFVTNGDRLVLGGLIDSNTFGVYVIAFFIFNSVEQLLSKIIGDVSFPAFSELARDKAINLKQAFSRFYCAAALFAYFCSGLLMVSGQTLIGVLYDKRYEQAGWMLEILAVALLVSPVHVTTACFLALGLPRLNSQLVGYRLVGLFLFVPLGFHLYGLIGAIWGIVASYFSTLIPSFFYRKNHGLFNLTEELFLLPAWFAGMLFAKGLNVVFGQ
jgi:O-antigen/teichoic acid export membrane protein